MILTIEQAQAIATELTDHNGPVQSLVVTSDGQLADDQHSEPARLESESALRQQIAGWLADCE